MKVTTTKPEFTAVSITITFETQKELDDFGCLCNACCIGDNIEMPDFRKMEELGANIDKTDELVKKIKIALR